MAGSRSEQGRCLTVAILVVLSLILSVMEAAGATERAEGKRMAPVQWCFPTSGGSEQSTACLGKSTTAVSHPSGTSNPTSLSNLDHHHFSVMDSEELKEKLGDEENDDDDGRDSSSESQSQRPELSAGDDEDDEMEERPGLSGSGPETAAGGAGSLNESYEVGGELTDVTSTQLKNEGQCLVELLPDPMKTGGYLQGRPYMAFRGCRALNTFRVLHYDKSQFPRVDRTPTYNETALCAAECAVKRPYLQNYQIAMGSNEVCLCLDAADAMSGQGEDCGKFTYSQDAPVVRIVNVHLVCPLNLTLCPYIVGCGVVEGCCQFSQKAFNQYRFGPNGNRPTYYTQSIHVIVFLVVILALLEMTVYTIMRRRAQQRALEIWRRAHLPRREDSEADDIVDQLMATFEPCEHKDILGRQQQLTKESPSPTTAAAATLDIGAKKATPQKQKSDREVDEDKVPLASAAARTDDEDEETVTSGSRTEGTVVEVTTAEAGGKKEEEEDADHCAICLEELGSKLVIQLPQCKHILHADCLKEYLTHEFKKKDDVPCPMCRTCIGSARQFRTADQNRVTAMRILSAAASTRVRVPDVPSGSVHNHADQEELEAPRFPADMRPTAQRSQPLEGVPPLRRVGLPVPESDDDDDTEDEESEDDAVGQSLAAV